MRRRTAIASSILATAAIVAGGAIFVGLPRWSRARPPAASAEPEPAPAAVVPRITATLFFVAEDGLHLAAVEREVPFQEGAAHQATRIVEAQLMDAPAPFLSAIPRGTTLRALYVTERGDAFVDLSREVATAHPGGSLNELFTVYTIVNALTANLPAIAAVQILVDGREVDTLAGHVDLRRPLGRDARWVAEPGASRSPES